MYVASEGTLPSPTDRSCVSRQSQTTYSWEHITWIPVSHMVPRGPLTMPSVSRKNDTALSRETSTYENGSENSQALTPRNHPEAFQRATQRPLDAYLYL